MRQPMKPRNAAERRKVVNLIVMQRQHQKRRAANIWTPARLFAQGQQGVWYEPKPEYLYQDSAGTTPVTAGGDPGGLMLDRHLGLELGANISPGATLQNNNGAIVTLDDAEIGLFTFSSDGSSSNNITSRIRPSTDAEKYYQTVIEVISVSGDADISVNQDNTGAGYIYNQVSVSEGDEYRAIIRRGAGTDDPFISFNGQKVFSAEVKISVRELPGSHAPQSASSLKPLYAVTPQHLNFDEFDDVLPVTFPEDMGADVTIGRAVPGVGGEILTGQTVGTSYNITQDMAALIIVNETPSADNLSKLQAYLDTMAGV